MDIKYYCNNFKCQEALKKPYVLTLKLETVMDEKNIAKMFCPHCRSELTEKKI